MNTSYSLIKPVPFQKMDQPDRRRFPRSGPNVLNKKTIKIQEIKNSLSLTTKVFAEALSEFDEVKTSPETLQAYIQGYIASDELIDIMLKRMQAFLDSRSPQEKKFSRMSMVEIIDEWLEKLHIDPLDAQCPWRKLSKITDKNHSILFRWYQGNRKPRSIDTVIAIDHSVSDFIKNHPIR